MSAIKVNKNNINSIMESERPVLLDFYAEWCGPCRMVSPIVDEIAGENPQYVIGKINVESEPELANRFGIISIPTLMVIKGGDIVSRSSGARPKGKILEMLEA